jgi:hypothetical protein
MADQVTLAKPRRFRRPSAWAIFAVIVAGIIGFVAGKWMEQQRTRLLMQNHFLWNFEKSFRSGRTKLLGRPRIEEVSEDVRLYHQVLRPFAPLELKVVEYRIVAQFAGPTGPHWGGWSYYCHLDSVNLITAFSFIQSEHRNLLKTAPKAYVPWTNEMVDGIPITNGAEAKIVSLTDPATIGQPVQLVVNSPAGTRTEVALIPEGLAVAPPTAQPPDSTGNVTWTWTLKPTQRREATIEIKCFEPFGKVELVRNTRKNFNVSPAANSSNSPDAVVPVD